MREITILTTAILYVFSVGNPAPLLAKEGLGEVNAGTENPPFSHLVKGGSCGALNTYAMFMAAVLSAHRLAGPAAGERPSAEGAEAAGPEVTISGGYVDLERRYRWQVANHHASSVVYIQFPHYLARMFLAPDGWTTESTNLVNVGVRAESGTCAARANKDGEGIRPGDSAEFVMSMADSRAIPRRGTVVVRFADGRQREILEVEVPGPPRAGDKYMTLIALGVIFGVWICFRALRSQRNAVVRSGRSEDTA